MYLSNLHIRNFRCFREIDLALVRGLNVIVGENNTGKTAIIDALRIGLSTGNQRRDISIHPEDFYNGTSEEIEIDLYFSGVTDPDASVFLELLSLANTQPELQLHLRFRKEYRRGIERVTPRYWGGDNEGQSIALEVLDLLYHIYLGALRDPERELSPTRGNRLSQLILKTVPDQHSQEEYAHKLQEKISAEDSWQTLIGDVAGQINSRLQEISLKTAEQKIKVDFIPYEFKRIAESLKMLIPRPPTNGTEVPPFEISQNSLGYNNLIFMATVLGDLVKRKKVERETFIAMLIEEPEAHLHPQLQDILFNFLLSTSEEDVQVIVTSHSPTITSKADVDRLGVLSVDTSSELSAFAVKNAELEREEKNYLRRFLDVTKSQLLFAKGVLLVEGISEGLMLPVLARILGYDLDEYGIEVVNIGGTAFAPFAKLFNHEDSHKRLSTRCSILTDDDQVNGVISPRAARAKTLAGGNLKIFLANRTFEAELFNAGNERIMLAGYKIMHPGTDISGADEFLDRLKSNGDKAEYAQLLAERISEGEVFMERFHVPEYIKQAIMHVVAI